MTNQDTTAKTINGGLGVWDGPNYWRADAQYWTEKQNTQQGDYQALIDYANDMVTFELTGHFPGQSLTRKQSPDTIPTQTNDTNMETRHE